MQSCVPQLGISLKGIRLLHLQMKLMTQVLDYIVLD